MSNTQNHLIEHISYPWQTKTFATNNHIEEQTARKRYCQTGSYFGVIPKKHANGRLLWPAVIVTKHGLIAVNDGHIAATDTTANANKNEVA